MVSTDQKATDQKLPGSPPSYDELYSASNSSTAAAAPPTLPNRQSVEALPDYNESLSQQGGLNSSNVPHHPDFTDPNAPRRTPDDLYTANLSLPWRYPKGHFCQKCKNTGYKTRNGRPCNNCWRRFQPNTAPTYGFAPTQYNPIPAPKLNPNVVSIPGGTTYSLYPFSFATSVPSTTYYYGAPPAPVPMQASRDSKSGSAGVPPPTPLVVGPGDPRIGGVLCNKCGGSGQIRFFLDTETCPQCRGLGRFGV